VQIHRDYFVGAARLDQTGYVRSADGCAREHLAVLSALPELGNDHRHRGGSLSARSGDHQEQFDQVFVDWKARGLHYDNLLTSERLVEGNLNFPVPKSADIVLGVDPVKSVFDFA